jgi:DASS family divalent anion:Na+ symporter
LTDPAVGDALEVLLRQVAFFRALERVDIARLIGALEPQHLPAGATIISEGDAADGLYLMQTGHVAVTVRAADGETSLSTLEAPAAFGEMGLLLARRTATVRALSEVRLWKLPRDRFEQLIQERPRVALNAAIASTELLERSQRRLLGAPQLAPPEAVAELLVPARARGPVWRLAGLALAVGVPAVLWLVPPPGGLSQAGWHVTLIVLGAALGWLFEPLPDFVIAFLMAAAWGVAGLAPVALVFGGFATSAWVVTLGSIALAVAMARSGLLFRIALFLLRTFPATHRGQVLALLLGGILVTPLVPLGLARVAAVTPLTQELAQALGYRPRSRGRAGLAFAGLVGYGLFGSIFLTGLAMNFFVVGLLSPGDRARFDWLHWLVGAAPVGILLALGAAFVLGAFFPPETTPKITAEVVQRQQRALRGLSRREGIATAGVGVLVLGLLMQPLVRLDAAWLALGALIVCVGGGLLDRGAFRSALDWGFLTMIGILLSTEGVLHHAGVDRWIAGLLTPIARLIPDPAALVVLLAVFVVACRLVLPWIPATLLLALALVPPAGELGLSPWVVGFVVLFAATTWIHPNQSDFCRIVREGSQGEAFTNRQGIALGAAMTAVMLIAVAASVPYWRALGLLTR